MAERLESWDESRPGQEQVTGPALVRGSKAFVDLLLRPGADSGGGVAAGFGTGTASRHQTELPEPVARALLAVARQSDLSLFIMMLGLFAGFAGRCTGQHDQALLIPCCDPHGQPRPGEDIVVSPDVDLAGSLRDLVLEARRVVLGAYRGDAAEPPAAGLAAIGGAADGGHPAVRLNSLHGPLSSVSRCAFVLEIERRDAAITLVWIHDPVTTDSTLVAALASAFAAFVSVAAADFHVPLAALPLGDAASLEQVRGFGRGAKVPLPAMTLDASISAQAAATPAGVALQCAQESLTYAELDALSDALAAGLAARGVGPGTVVALQLPTSPAAVALAIGIMKAGAAFAPISLTEPALRLAQQLAECGACLLICEDGDGQGAAAIPACNLTDLLAAVPASGQRSSAPAASEPAYVIFTSGTSGKPKAVLTDHAGIMNAVVWKNRTYALGPGDVVLPLFGHEFDGFVLNAFAPLCAGATVVLAPDADRVRPAQLAQAIAAGGVTHLATSPALYALLLNAADPALLRTLRSVVVAGDAAAREVLTRSRVMLPGVQLANEYGPTENAVVSTWNGHLEPDWPRLIGLPIDNVGVTVRDEGGALVPVGVPGEIYLSGPALAARSARADAKNAVKPELTRSEPGYATGDYARWHPDGTLEYIGRRSGFLKLQGRRVDPEEVRAALLSHPEVSDACVFADGSGEAAVLCAAIVAAGGAQLAEIQAGLQARLPSHLIPARLRQVDALPLGPGGKVAVARLRELIRNTAPLAAGAAPPSLLEQQLVELWQAVLGRRDIGLDASFFELGGHSLRAVQLLSAIHEAFGVTLNLGQVFSDNTVRKQAELIVGSSPAKQAGLAAETESSDEFAPLTAAQARMVALEAELPGAYDLPVLFELAAPIDAARIEQALSLLLLRHDALRARFESGSGQWSQMFDCSVQVAVSHQALAPGMDLAAAARTATQPFDLGRGPLVRAAILTGTDGRQFFLLSFHHVVIDEVGLDIVLRELEALYRDPEAALPPAESYARHARAQRAVRQSEGYRLAVQEAAALVAEAAPPPLHLARTGAASASSRTSGAVAERIVPAGLVAQLRDVTRSAGATDFMMLMACFSILLSRYAGQSSLAIGAPVSTRRTAQDRNLVGLCLNTVPFLFALPPRCRFTDYLDLVRASISASLRYAEVEFDDLARALPQLREFGENPIYSALLNIVDSRRTSLELGAAIARHRPLGNGAAKLDLVLEIDFQAEQPRFALEYPAELIAGATAERMADSFLAILAQVAANPALWLHDIDVISPQDQATLRVWSGCDAIGAPAEGSIAGWFEGHAADRADKVAVVCGEERLTYGALNALSNRLCAELKSRGCGPDDVVGIFCDRSPRLIAAIMAVQKAGAAHLPLDPYYPEARTARMLALSGAKILIADQDPGALEFPGAVIDPAADWSHHSPDNPGRPGPEGKLGYVLYTSGTTGEPKGVMVGRDNLLSLVGLATARLQVGPADVWTLYHSVCFDVSVWEMFGCLLTGGTLVIVSRAATIDPEQVLALLEQERVTVFCQPPSGFYLLAETMLHHGRPTSLRYAILGGEAVKTSLLVDWNKRYGSSAQLVNGYGITETTVYSTFKLYNDGSLSSPNSSIGQAVPGTSVYVLNQDFKAVPIGAIGELYIGGLGVGLGYRGRRDLTEARFVDDPFRRGSLMYKSGDLAVWLPNGEIGYAGRIDKQIKIRGYRVEPGEIEAAMIRYSSVRESVVLATRRGELDVLCGFFVSDAKEDIQSMRSQLEQELPNYMVPAILTQVDQMPLTPNGKVAHAELLGAIAAPSEPSRTPPSGDLHEEIAALWSDVIGVPVSDIGNSDNFFTLGGDSIGANLVVKLLQHRGHRLELLDLFERPTIASLAELMIANAGAGSAGSADPESVSSWLERDVGIPIFALAGSTPQAGDAARIRHTLQIALGAGELAAADAGVMASAVATGLRMVSGGSAFRLCVADTPPEAGAEPGLSHLVVRIDDVSKTAANLASVRAAISKVGTARLPLSTVLADPRLRRVLADAVILRDAAGQPEDEGPAWSAASLVATWQLCDRELELSLNASAASWDQARLSILSEAVKLSLHNLRATGIEAESGLPRRRVSFPVQPLADAFFQDCTQQALITAARHFGMSLPALLASAVPACVPQPKRSCGLRIAVGYNACAPIESLMTAAGLSVRTASAVPDICAQLIDDLDHERLGIVKLDCFYVRQQRDLFQTRHGDHTVLVTGYDEAGGYFDIVDNEAARDVRYRRTTIPMAELAEAYQGYQQRFNPCGDEPSAMSVCRTVPMADRGPEAALALERLHEGLARLNAAGALESEAFALLADDAALAGSTAQSMTEHSDRLAFAMGEVLMAKRLLHYQLEHIQKDQQLAGQTDNTVTALETALGIIVKFGVAAHWSAERADALCGQIDRAVQSNLDFLSTLALRLEN